LQAGDCRRWQRHVLSGEQLDELLERRVVPDDERPLRVIRQAGHHGDATGGTMQVQALILADLWHGRPRLEQPLHRRATTLRRRVHDSVRNLAEARQMAGD